MTILSDKIVTPPMRIPPVGREHFMVVRRGQVRFCLRARQVTKVGPWQGMVRIDPWSNQPVKTVEWEGKTAGLIEVEDILLSNGESQREAPRMYAALASEPVVLFAVDEIIALRTKGSELRAKDETRTETGQVVIAGEVLPLLDATAAEEWMLSPASDPVEDEGQVNLLTGSQTELDEWAERILRGFELPEKPQLRKSKHYDVCIVGGLGHVGLPLGIALAEAGKKVVLYDVNRQALEEVRRARMPFKEEGSQKILNRVLGKTLWLSCQKQVIAHSYFVVIVIGTPVDGHLNPQFTTFKKFIDEIIDQIHDEQHIILRSTVYPGTTEKVKGYLESSGKQTRLSYCPERIAQGKALEELRTLPQIVASFDRESLREVSELFGLVTPEVQVLSPTEAELAKLFCNTWRYIQFAISNQFYQVAAAQGLDFYRIYGALKRNYPRLEGMARPGFAAGPCLFKDTMQLAAFSNNNFFLGHAAMLINEGMPNFIVQQLKEKYPLSEMSAGILGMAFKADNDDKRESLSYKLKKILEIEARQVFCSDVYIKEPGFVDAEELVRRCDIVILGAPHEEYTRLNIGVDKHLVDIWDFFGEGGWF